MDNFISKEKFIELLNVYKNYIQQELALYDIGLDISNSAARADFIDKYEQMLAAVTHLSIDDLYYWAYDLDFGKKYKSGMVIDANGLDISFETPEDLYNYVLDNLKEKRKDEKDWLNF